MKFAVNYSVGLSNCLKEDGFHVDLIKCPEWDGLLMEARKIKPVYIHFDIRVGNGTVYHLDWKKIHYLMELTDTPHLNCHLVTTRDTDPDSPSDTLRMLKTWENEINLLSAQVGNKHLAVEHFPFMPYNPHMRAAVDAKNISAIVEQTGCRFLFDLAHARITALNLNLDEKAYAHSLPIHQIVELHITGIKPYNGFLVDHFELGDADWDYASWVFDLIRSGTIPKPYITAFEYGGVTNTFAWRSDQAILKAQIPRLSKLVASI